MSSIAPPAGTTGLTYADLLALPEPSEAGGTRYEILDGELLVTPSGVPRHQQAITRLVMALHAWTEERGGETLPAPMDVVFSDTTVLQPDVLGPDRTYEPPVVSMADDQLRSTVLAGFSMPASRALAL